MNSTATWLTLALGRVIGCGDSRIASVHGRVTLEGQGVGPGRIAFDPPSGRAAVGAIAADGSYRLTTLTTNDGALIGPHKVTIDIRQVTTASEGPKSIDEEITQGSPPPRSVTLVWVVPARHAEIATTPLTAEVRSGSNEINFDIRP